MNIEAPTESRLAKYYLLLQDAPLACELAGIHPTAWRRVTKRAGFDIFVDVARDDLMEKHPDLAERILQELERVAFYDIRKIVQWDAAGNVAPIPSAELSDEAAAAVATVVGGKQGFRLTPHNKLKALELLGKAVGLFDEHIEVRSGPGIDPKALTDEELAAIIAERKRSRGEGS